MKKSIAFMLVLSSLLFSENSVCMSSDYSGAEQVQDCLMLGSYNFIGKNLGRPSSKSIDEEKAFKYFYRACSLGSGIGCYFSGEVIDHLSPNYVSALTKDDPMPTRYTLFAKACDSGVKLGCIEAARDFFELSSRRFSSEGNIKEGEFSFFYKTGELFLKRGCDDERPLSPDEKFACEIVKNTAEEIKRVGEL